MIICYYGITEQYPRCQDKAAPGSDYCLLHMPKAQACVVRFCYQTTTGPLCTQHEKEYLAVHRDRFGIADFCLQRKGWLEATKDRIVYQRGGTH